MEIEVIPNTGLYEKDCKKFKMIRKENGETHYYVTLNNNGGRCPCCGKYVTTVKELKVKKIIHDKNQIIHYSARRLNFDRFKNRAMYCENYYETYSQDKLTNTVKRHFPKKKTDLG